MRDGEAVTHQPHKLKIEGSNPSPATNVFSGEKAPWGLGCLINSLAGGDVEPIVGTTSNPTVAREVGKRPP